MAKSFAQHVIEKILPPGMTITKPLTKGEFENIMEEVYEKYPGRYDQVVTDMKRIGDRFSTLDAFSFGLDELSVPNKVERDSVIRKAKRDLKLARTDAQKINVLEKVQDEIARLDMKGGTDDASLMIQSGAYGNKRFQLMKLRSSPVVLMDHKGNLVEDIVDKSYAQGVGVLDFWNGAAEARAKGVQGQVSTSEPGALNKVVHNLLADVVVSTDDCHTKFGIELSTASEDVLDRYLAVKAGRYIRGTLITSSVQKSLMRARVKTIIVRSPQTCEAPENTVCSKCMGLSIGKRTKLPIGENAGAITAGAISEPATQLVLSAKHSTTLAKRDIGLSGRRGLQAVLEMPKIYPHRQIICELYGKVYRVIPAPQGGKYVEIMETRKVPDRYVINAEPMEGKKRFWRYYIPPQRELFKSISKGEAVYPGMPLTDGNTNLKDVARLRSLGAARTEAVENIRNVYKNTGQNLDRRHFELLARSMMNYVKLEKVPVGFPFVRGEVVQYNKIRGLVDKLHATPKSLDDTLGLVLAEEVHGLTLGTEITPAVQQQLQNLGKRRVKVTSEFEVSPVVVGLSRVQNMADTGWMAKMNHRYLSDTLKNAAAEGQVQAIRSYSPHAAYAIGTELTDRDKFGRY